MNPKDQQIQLLITIRLKRIHQEGFVRVKYKDLERIFFNYVWKKQIPSHISAVTDTILNISTDDIIKYLSVEANKDSKNMSLEELLEGTLYET